jgi:hypothetical protein
MHAWDNPTDPDRQPPDSPDGPNQDPDDEGEDRPPAGHDREAQRAPGEGEDDIDGGGPPMQAA